MTGGGSRSCCAIGSSPLELRGTSFDTSPGIEGPHLHGHVVVDGKPEDTEGISPSYVWAAGDIVSTARDLATFYRALLRGRLAGRAALREMRHAAAGLPVRARPVPGEDAVRRGLRP